MKRRPRFAPSEQLDTLVAGLDSVRPQPPALAELPQHVERGVVSIHPRGFGFLTTDEGGSVFIPFRALTGLMSGDRIEATVLGAEGAAGREVERVLRVSRASSTLLCEVQAQAAGVCLVADDPCHVTLQVSPAELASYVVGEVVCVTVPPFAGAPGRVPVEVRFEASLGPRTRKEFDIDYALYRYGLQGQMPAAVVAEAAQLLERRETAALDPSPYVTIDGERTRDFDDALFARKQADGWELRVAIADVSWFVRPGTALDAWAAERCTSVYLPTRTLPMLPEVLSNGECSLTPSDYRRAVILTLALDEEGQVRHYGIERGFIQSAARLTYDQVAADMEGTARLDQGEAVRNNLTALAQLYRVLSELRRSRGALSFEDAEPSLEPTADGCWELTWHARTEAHKLVEEMMLLANHCAARHLIARYGAGVFRHQPTPTRESWDTLRAWAAGVALPEVPCLRSMATLVATQPDDATRAVAAMKVQQSMRPASYVVRASHEEGGHFSLNMDWYTHFTSPIRRYADLLVHRLLLAPEGHVPSEAEWVALTEAVSRCAVRAQAAKQAERFVWDRIKLEAYLVNVAAAEVVPARVLRGTGRGMRVLLVGWSVAAWLPAPSLRKNGWRWSAADQVWVHAADARALREGMLVDVQRLGLDMSRPAYPELQVSWAEAA